MAWTHGCGSCLALGGLTVGRLFPAVSCTMHPNCRRSRVFQQIECKLLVRVQVRPLGTYNPLWHQLQHLACTLHLALTQVQRLSPACIACSRPSASFVPVKAARLHETRAGARSVDLWSILALCRARCWRRSSLGSTAPAW